jgi:hypothetical protein
MTQTQPVPSAKLLDAVKAGAHAAKVFGKCEVRDGMLVCRAANSAAPASYRLFADKGTLYLAMVTADRWLSESIESDLVEYGDHLEELLEEELVELGYSAGTLSFEHYRSDDLLFTFRSPLPVRVGDESAEAVKTLTTLLIGYEQCFRRLGDMDAGMDSE